MEKTINELQMKYIIILGDGMADEPIGSLGGRTPLQAACKPSIDRVAALGRSGMLATVPAGFAPGSEIANLSVLGYDLPKVFEGGAVRSKRPAWACGSRTARWPCAAIC